MTVAATAWQSNGPFRSKSLQLLIATDVAARGIDVDGVTHVINYELPDDMDVHPPRGQPDVPAKQVCFRSVTVKV